MLNPAGFTPKALDVYGDIVHVGGAGAKVPGTLARDSGQDAIVGHDLVVDFTRIPGARDAIGRVACGGKRLMGRSVVGDVKERICRQLPRRGIGRYPPRIQEERGRDVPLAQRVSQRLVITAAAGAAAKRALASLISRAVSVPCPQAVPPA
jgi:hypothetical protein